MNTCSVVSRLWLDAFHTVGSKQLRIHILFFATDAELIYYRNEVAFSD